MTPTTSPAVPATRLTTRSPDVGRRTTTTSPRWTVTGLVSTFRTSTSVPVPYVGAIESDDTRIGSATKRRPRRTRTPATASDRATIRPRVRGWSATSSHQQPGASRDQDGDTRAEHAGRHAGTHPRWEQAGQDQDEAELDDLAAEVEGTDLLHPGAGEDREAVADAAGDREVLHRVPEVVWRHER